MTEETTTERAGAESERLAGVWNGLRRLVGRWIGRVPETLPTVRARLFALVGLALVPALVILVYDEWLARQRGLDAFADVSTRVVRLMRLDLDGRITRAAGRLSTLAADPEVVSLGPLAGRRIVDAFRDDRLYNNLMIVNGVSGDLRVSAVPFERAWSARDRTAYQRALQSLDLGIGVFIPEPATGLSGLNIAQPAIDEQGRVASVLFTSLSMGWVEGFIESSGLHSGTVLAGFDDQGIVEYRSKDAEKYVGRKGVLASVLGGAVEGRTDLDPLLADLEARVAVAFRSIDTLREAKAPAPSEPDGPFVPAEARAALERLQAALGDSDLSAASCALSDLGGVAMPGGAAADLALLRNHVDSYEYDDAQVLATRLLEGLGGGDL